MIILVQSLASYVTWKVSDHVAKPAFYLFFRPFSQVLVMLMCMPAASSEDTLNGYDAYKMCQDRNLLVPVHLFCQEVDMRFKRSLSCLKWSGITMTCAAPRGNGRHLRNEDICRLRSQYSLRKVRARDLFVLQNSKWLRGRCDQVLRIGRFMKRPF